MSPPSSVAVVTGVYGGYDPLRGLPADHGFDDAVVVTDDPSLCGDGWRVVVAPRVGEHPRLAAKLPKMMPWLFTDCEAAVWVDASFEVLNGRLAALASMMLGQHRMVVFRHPDDRGCYLREARFCQDWVKYRDWPLREQVRAYQAEGMPEGWGLFACGVVGWRVDAVSRMMGLRWWSENARWSIQDQVSLPYLVWSSGWDVGLWPMHEFMNPVLRYHHHARED